MHPLPSRDLQHILDTAQGDLNALDGARVFMTGGTGFLGRWLVESWALARRGRLRGDLVVLTRDPARWRAAFPPCPGLVFTGGDQADFPFPEGAFDAVIHGAFQHGTPAVTFQANLLGCRRVLEFSRRAGAARCLLLSSGAAFDPGEEPPADQAYGAAKGASEALGAAFQAEGGPVFVSARGFAFVGPGLPLDLNFAIGNFIRDALGGGPIRVQGDGTPLRSYLYAADAAAWHWALLARGAGGLPYDVGSSQAVSILDLAERVRDLLAPGAAVEVAGRPEPGRRPGRYLPDTSRAERELGLREWIGLEEGIRRTAAWYGQRDGDLPLP